MGGKSYRAGAAGRSSGSAQPLWFHGTTVEFAEQILSSRLVGRAERGRGQMAPLPGRSYLTRDLVYALSYVFKGLVEYQDGVWKIHGRKEAGAILLVEPSLGGCVPDEDWLGELLISPDLKPLEPALSRLIQAVRASVSSRTSASWASIPNFYRSDYGKWARAGKTAINQLLKTKSGRDILRMLVEWSPSVACEGESVRVVSGWLLRREDVARLAPDGSNLKAVGMQIVNQGAA